MWSPFRGDGAAKFLKSVLRRPGKTLRAWRVRSPTMNPVMRRDSTGDGCVCCERLTDHAEGKRSNKDHRSEDLVDVGNWNLLMLWRVILVNHFY